MRSAWLHARLQLRDALIVTVTVIVLIDSVRKWIGGRKQPELPADPALAEA